MWRYFRLSLITQRKGIPAQFWPQSFTWDTYLWLTASCRLELFSFASWSEGFVKWRSSQKRRLSTELMIIATIRNVCLQLTWMHSMLRTEIQRTSPLNRNKTSCTCWQHALIIQLFTKSLFTFLKIKYKHQFFFFLVEIDLWNYLLLVMSCLFVEQMCIG